MRVGLFTTCYADAFHPEVGIATLELLERLGCEVEYPIDQTCCGQPRTDVPNIHHAHRRPKWRDARYAVFQTGPSATAGIEGVLIHGAQGVRSLSAAPVRRDGGLHGHG